MESESYCTSNEDGILERIKEVVCTGGFAFRLALPYEETGFRASLPYAEEIYYNLDEFVERLGKFKEDQYELYNSKYLKSRYKLFLDCANEMKLLTVKTVAFCGTERPDLAEVTFHDLPGSWRYWFCGYSKGNLFDLYY